MSKLPRWLVLVLAPLEIAGCMAIGALRGAKDGYMNVRDALR